MLTIIAVAIVASSMGVLVGTCLGCSAAREEGFADGYRAGRIAGHAAARCKVLQLSHHRRVAARG